MGTGLGIAALGESKLQPPVHAAGVHAFDLLQANVQMLTSKLCSKHNRSQYFLTKPIMTAEAIIAVLP